MKDRNVMNAPTSLRGQNATLRRASLVDVPAITRLVASHGFAAQYIAPEQEQQASSTLRLLLAHHALETGAVWLAEEKPGRLAAVATWQPAHGRELDPAEVERLLAREVGALEGVRSTAQADAAAIRRRLPREPHGVLVLARRQGRMAAGIAMDLVCTALRELGPHHDLVIAVSRSAGEGHLLEGLGFSSPREISLPSGVCLWLSERRVPTGDGQARRSE
uniref:N-acetyltransferase domain-containing protein n=1 Tax=Streptomyces sp. WT6 TaxID=1486372 RepID=A0A023PZN1_9ACTN|nr:hypothetical protein wt6.9 [Streptomyces sp. WT6]